MAKRFTADFCFGEVVTVVTFDTDRYGRTVGDVLLRDGRNLNHALVQAGLAWWYRKHSDSPVLERLEKKARKDRIGLWSQANPVPPWEFRKRSIRN